jgi:DNA-binding transcriptional ArsR family regulator
MLASEAGVAASTASHHLARLVDGGLITVRTRGRHRYYALAGADVADLLEAVARVAPPQPVTSLREGTRAHALRYARRCYDHLAGRLGVALADALERDELVVVTTTAFTLTGAGASRLSALGFAAEAGAESRSCRDWTEQRSHVAGPLGRTLLNGMLDRGWLLRDVRTRALRVTPSGEAALLAEFGVDVP